MLDQPQYDHGPLLDRYLQRRGLPITLTPAEICRLDPKESAYDYALFVVRHFNVTEIVSRINELAWRGAPEMKIPCFDSRIHMALVRRSDETGMSVERTLSEINNERRRRGLKPLKHGRGRQAWSDEEDRSLKHLKEVLQLPWAAIAEHFPHRTVGGISNHYFEIKNEKRTTDIPTSIEAASESTSEPPKQTSTKDVSYDEFSKVVHRRVRRLAAHLEVLRKSPITLTKAGMNYIIETLPKESKKSAQAIRAQQISQAEKAKRIVSVIDKLLIRFIAAAAGEDTKDGKEALTSMLFRKRMEEDEILFAPLNDKETK